MIRVVGRKQTFDDPEVTWDLRRLTDPLASAPTPAEALRILEKHNTGVTVHLAPNLTDSEAALAVGNVIRQRKGLDIVRIPEDHKHVIVAHGMGEGDGHILKAMKDGGGQSIKVQDYVNSRIPKGERAWCVICSDEHARNIPGLEGKSFTSLGSAPSLEETILRQSEETVSKANRFLPKGTGKWAAGIAAAAAVSAVGWAWYVKHGGRSKSPNEQNVSAGRSRD